MRLTKLLYFIFRLCRLLVNLCDSVKDISSPDRWCNVADYSRIVMGSKLLTHNT